jgi:hypothetical protein
MDGEGAQVVLPLPASGHMSGHAGTPVPSSLGGRRRAVPGGPGPPLTTAGQVTSGQVRSGQVRS